MTDIPLSRVLAAIIPTPRTTTDKPCQCAACYEERARDHAREDWRRSREVEL